MSFFEEAAEAGMTPEQYGTFLRLQGDNLMLLTMELEQQIEATEHKIAQQQESAARTEKKLIRQRKVLARAFIFAILLCALLVLDLYQTKKETYINGNLAAGTLPVRLELNCVQTEYRSLGTDIAIRYYHKGKQVESGDVVNTGRKLTVEAEIIEFDPTTDDFGSGEITFSIPPLERTKQTKITVYEAGGGGHSGSASWWFSCSCKAKLGLFAVLFYS